MADQTSIEVPQYDESGIDYHKWRHLAPIPLYIKMPFVKKLMHNLSGKTVLDLACGDGYMTRFIKHLGAKHVVGVDISKLMIELAQRDEKDCAMGIEYICADVQDIGTVGTFDYVTAFYLFCYAPNRDVLRKFADVAYNNLAPGGKLVALVPDGQADLIHDPDVDKELYGINVAARSKRFADGEKTQFEIYDTKSKMLLSQFDYYNWHRKSYLNALESAGFTNIDRHKPEVSSEGINKFGPEYWEHFLRPSPYFYFLTAQKPSTA